MSMILSVLLENATGWSELVDANPVGAVYTMFNGTEAWNGWFVFLLFAIYTFMLYQKTQSPVLVFTIGALFAGIYVATEYIVFEAKWIIFMILAVAMAAVFMFTFIKR